MKFKNYCYWQGILVHENHHDRVVSEWDHFFPTRGRRYFPEVTGFTCYSYLVSSFPSGIFLCHVDTTRTFPTIGGEF